MVAGWGCGRTESTFVEVKLKLAKATHPEHNNPIQNTWVTQGDRWAEAHAQVGCNTCRLQMESWSETISLAFDHWGLRIVLLMEINKTRAEMVKVCGLSKSALMSLKAVTNTCSSGATGNILYDISIYCKCRCWQLALTGTVCRLIYKKIVVFWQPKTCFWDSRATPSRLGCAMATSIKSSKWFLKSCWTSQNQQTSNCTGTHWLQKEKEEVMRLTSLTSYLSGTI